MNEKYVPAEVEAAAQAAWRATDAYRVSEDPPVVVRSIRVSGDRPPSSRRDTPSQQQ